MTPDEIIAKATEELRTRAFHEDIPKREHILIDAWERILYYISQADQSCLDHLAYIAHKALWLKTGPKEKVFHP